MNFDHRTVQARCAALGFNPGPIDGIKGKRTRSAIEEAMDHFEVTSLSGLFHPSGLHTIIWHWTAGAYGVIDLERRAYNALIDQDAKRHLGQWSFEDQAHYRAGVRGASHALNANSGRIGMSMDCMANANERPFRWGSAPMTWGQVDELTRWTAELSKKYWIPITRFSTLSHAEVQPTLGIRQRFKWDITILPDMNHPGDPIDVGDRVRALTMEHVGRVDTCLAA